MNATNQYFYAIMVMLISLVWALTQAAMAYTPIGTSNGKTHYSKHEIQRMVINIANDNKTVPASIALAVARVESSFNPSVTSSAGARGVMQIMPATAMGEFGVAADRLYQPELNIQLGVLYLERLYFQYGQEWELALSHYNGGSLKKRNGRYQPHSYTSSYVRKVFGYASQYAYADTKQQLQQNLQNLDQEQAKTASINYVFRPKLIKNGDWRHYLAAADQFLNPDTAAPLPAAMLVPAKAQRPEKATNYITDEAPSSQALKARANFRSNILNKINR